MKKILKELFFINFLNLNGALTQKSKEKYPEDSDDVAKSVFKTKIVLNSILLGILYGVLFGFLGNYKKTPYMLDFIIGFLSILGILEIFIGFVNILFESGDTEAYQALPIPSNVIFRSRILTVSTLAIPFLIPSIILFTKFFADNDFSIFSIIAGIINAVIFAMIILGIGVIFTRLLGRKMLGSRYKNKILTIINVIITGLSVLFIVRCQTNMNKATMGYLEDGVVKYYPLSKLISTPQGELMFILGSLFILALIYLFFFKHLEENYIEILQLKGGTKKVIKKHKLKNRQSLKNTLLKYNLGLIKNPTVLQYSVLSAMITPIICLGPMMMNSFSRDTLANMTLGTLDKSIAIASLIGLFFAVLVKLGTNSLVAVMISLEGKDYEYFKTMPISEKTYLISKLKACFLATDLPMIILISVASKYFLNAKSPFIITMIVFYTVIATARSISLINWDRKHVLTDWQNVSAIYSRGNKVNQIVITFVMFLGLILLSSIEGFLISKQFSIVAIILNVLITFAIVAISLIKNDFLLFK